MYCTSCGADNPNGSVFCSVCGARMGSEAQTSQQPYGQPPYGQPPYDQPYGQQPYGQPPKKAKSKAVWFIAGGAVLLIAIALVLIFVVFPGGTKTTGGDADGLLSGSTMQAEFFNDGAEVFSNALSGMGGIDAKRLTGEPFDIDMKLRAEVSGFPVEIKASAAYDEEKLGMLAEAAGQEMVLLLDDDMLYVSSAGSVSGYRFDTSEDMSEPMPLKKRVTALVKGLIGDADKYTLLIEAMIDNISEDCFKKGKDKTTLTLASDDMIDMLEALDEKAKKDDDLSDAMDDLNWDIDDAINNMKEEDFDLAVTVGYDGKTPVSLEVDYDDGTEYGAFNLQFGYEDTEDGREISLNATTAAQEIKGTIDTVKNGDKVEYEGSLSASYGGTPAGAYSIDGSEEWDGDEVKGSMTITDNNGVSYAIEYEGTVAFGMPEDKVEDDKRFDADTKGANVQDISDLINPSGLGGYDVPEVSVTEAAPAETQAAYGYGKLVGISLPTKSLERWNKDGENVTTALEALGYQVDLQYADYDVFAQCTQIENQITMGCDVLVIAAVDGGAMSGLLAEVKEAGIPVIAWDRLLMNTDKCDYYVSFSAYDVGRIQAEYIVDSLRINTTAVDIFTLECFAGDPNDNYAYLFYQGAMDVFQPYINAGEIVVRSGEAEFTDIAIQNWDSAAAQTRMKELIADYYSDEDIDAILSPNDTISQGIAVTLKAAGYGTADKPYPILTGQDCDKVSVGMISRGEQSMSVFKDTQVLSQQVIVTVDALLSGENVLTNATYNNGVIDVPTFNCDITCVDKDNWREILIDSGYYNLSDIPTY